MHPIVLSAPDVFGRPDLGDGRNQYVYDSVNEGKLLLPVTTSVAGAGSEDLSTIAQAIDWVVNPVPPGLQPYTRVPGTESIIPNSTTIYGNVLGSLVFVGQPAQNTQFGARTVTLRVNGSNSQRAQAQSFFPGQRSTLTFRLPTFRTGTTTGIRSIPLQDPTGRGG